LSVLSNGKFEMELYSEYFNPTPLNSFGHIYKTATPGSGNGSVSFLIAGEQYEYPHKGLKLTVYNIGSYTGLGFFFLDRDAWDWSTIFYLKVTYNNGVWKVYVNNVEVTYRPDLGNQEAFAPIRDDESGAAWYFSSFSDEIKFSKSI
jgi:hypothetical protein